jgi:hypothetical protein
MSVCGVIAAMGSDIREGVSRRLWHAGERMPRELRRSLLVLSEAPVSLRGPIRLHGRVDQVYRTEYGRGALVVVDSKMRRRDRVGADDLMQISVYAFILRREPLSGHENAPVSRYGYLRFVWDDVSRYRRVGLYPDRLVINAYREYVERSGSA